MRDASSAERLEREKKGNKRIDPFWKTIKVPTIHVYTLCKEYENISKSAGSFNKSNKRTSNQKWKSEFNWKLKTSQEALNQEQKPKSINQISKDKRLMNFKSRIKSNKHIHTSTTKSKHIKTLKIINQPSRASARVRENILLMLWFTTLCLSLSASIGSCVTKIYR